MRVNPKFTTWPEWLGCKPRLIVAASLESSPVFNPETLEQGTGAEAARIGVQGLGLRVSGFRFRVSGFRFQDSGSEFGGSIINAQGPGAETQSPIPEP